MQRETAVFEPPVGRSSQHRGRAYRRQCSQISRAHRKDGILRGDPEFRKFAYLGRLCSMFSAHLYSGKDYSAKRHCRLAVVCFLIWLLLRELSECTRNAQSRNAARSLYAADLNHIVAFEYQFRTSLLAFLEEDFEKEFQFHQLHSANTRNPTDLLGERRAAVWADARNVLLPPTSSRSIVTNIPSIPNRGIVIGRCLMLKPGLYRVNFTRFLLILRKVNERWSLAFRRGLSRVCRAADSYMLLQQM